MKKNFNLSKRLIILFLNAIILLNLVSCIYVKDKMKEEKVISFISQTGTDIIEALENQDCDKLSSIFCKKIANTNYLNDNINYLFNYINNNGGLVIPKGNWILRGSGHRAFNVGKKVVDYGGWNYNKEIEIGEKKYRLDCLAYFTLEGHKEYEGITHIIISEIIDKSNEELLSKINATINKNGRPQMKYLGIGIYNMNYETYLDENVIPKEVYQNEEYRFSFDELEKGHSKW